ncbi:MAG: hypothetical protein HRU06_06615 [Oceanospirillaceae bacterium]|nr:hypothetical protein [Oceanospirillaceae bacterium]
MKSLLILSLSFFSVLLQAEPVSKSYWGDKAIGSHDTVAYHQDAVKKAHKAVTGNQQFIVKYSGANWYFVSAASAAKFAQDPDKYKPLFNGFCANALSLGEGLVPTNGKIWEFFGDQLHLFYAEAGRQRWLTGDWQQYQQVAHSAWAGLKDK